MHIRERIPLITKDVIHLVLPDDILYCRCDNAHTTFFLVEGEPIRVAKSMKAVEADLKGARFFRAHQSYLVNVSHLKRVDKKQGFVLILSDDSRIPTASRKKTELMQILHIS